MVKSDENFSREVLIFRWVAQITTLVQVRKTAEKGGIVLVLHEVFVRKKYDYQYIYEISATAKIYALILFEFLEIRVFANIMRTRRQKCN